ncbi:MAG: Asp-tRNA(Asn)/Glu-tRNA(Gln) amidotransferase subunit GatC [Coriobacteriales bacterium]|jgi:aspartyl-tRNA(Asn)/glutamyl-tRNA(Gln) amidotransferase subunit C|nr:Asp-tRNA(Asn)/Glu-tRNA(Gln) amidotransferase subunit GatC [Coriobacteriales bacterium]
MHLSEKDVRDIAVYTRIGLSDEEVARMASDLSSIIESLGVITEYDLEGVEPTFHPIAGLSNVMREDVVRPGLAHEAALGNAPAEQDGQFLIPPILGDGGGDR